MIRTFKFGRTYRPQFRLFPVEFDMVFVDHISLIRPDYQYNTERYEHFSNMMREMRLTERREKERLARLESEHYMSQMIMSSTGVYINPRMAALNILDNVV